VLVKLFTYTLIMFVVTVVTFAYWLFNYKKPLEEEKLQINNKYKELLAKKKKGQRSKQQIRELQNEISNKKREIVALLKEKTKGRDVGKFLNDVELDSQNAGVNLRSIRIQPKTQRPRYMEIPLEFSVDGTYFELYDFFSRIEARQMLNLQNSQITLTGGGSDRGQAIKNLSNLIDKGKKLVDLNNKEVKLPKYNNESRFPTMRVNFDGRIIIIDRSHIAKYE